MLNVWWFVKIIISLLQSTAGHRPLQSLVMSLDLRLLALSFSVVCYRVGSCVPSRSGEGVSSQHIRGLLQQRGRRLHAVEGARHVLPEDGVVGRLDGLMPDL
jgi:hypothetical protein